MITSFTKFLNFMTPGAGRVLVLDVSYILVIWENALIFLLRCSSLLLGIEETKRIYGSSEQERFYRN